MFGKQVIKRKVIRATDGGILEHVLFKLAQARINLQRIFADQNLGVQFSGFKGSLWPFACHKSRRTAFAHAHQPVTIMHADNDIARAVHHCQCNFERVRIWNIKFDDFDFCNGWHKNLLDTDYTDTCTERKYGVTRMNTDFLLKKSVQLREIRQIRVLLLFSFINRHALFQKRRYAFPQVFTGDTFQRTFGFERHDRLEIQVI